jgi:FkbM family methyltransferase
VDIYTDLDNGFGYDLHLDGEEDLIRQCLGRTKDRFTFFDVGANRGDWTNFVISNCATAYEGHLFEISRVMRKRLFERIPIIVLDDGSKVTINEFGLSDTAAMRVFRRFVGAEGVNTLLTEADYWENDLPSVIEETQLITGDMYCAGADGKVIEHINLLKIDTEGWEMNVLRGFEMMFSEHRIDVAQFEYGYLSGENHTVARDFWRFLEPKGYTLGRLHKNGIDLSPFRYPYNNFTSGPNFVALSPDAMKDVT